VAVDTQPSHEARPHPRPQARHLVSHACESRDNDNRSAVDVYESIRVFANLVDAGLDGIGITVSVRGTVLL
jgi:hypothetical protein